MKALELQNVYDPDPQIYKNALNLIRSASLNCYLFEVCGGPQACMRIDQLACLHSSCITLGLSLSCRQTGRTPSRPKCHSCRSSCALVMRAPSA